MKFLQPWMLYALPLMALPILIHLINQRRYRTIRWAAMMFLLAAHRMSRGYARIRQWLILAARTLAIAGFLFALSRPLTSGWLSLAAGGRPDSTIILLDRSPSMQQQGKSGQSKLSSALRQLTNSLGVIDSQHWILIDSSNARPVELDSLAELSRRVESGGVSTSADLPAMLQGALKYIEENRPGRTDLWICSDLRQNDWDAESGRWQGLRDAFISLPQPVRIHLLSYSHLADRNRAIRITQVHRREAATGPELLVSLVVSQNEPGEGTQTIPVQLEVDGVRTEVSVELQGKEAEITDHVIPLTQQQVSGWGRVQLPADENLADNEFYFVYDQPAPHRTIIVCEDAEIVRPLQLAAAISPEPAAQAQVEVLLPDAFNVVDWDAVALILWQAPLPTEEAADWLQAFADRGGRILFFPPTSPTTTVFAGIRWEDWQNLDAETVVTSWMSDQDLLARTRNGAALPVGQLRVSRYCTLTGEQTALARLQGDEPLLVRAETPQRNIYFCTTTPAAEHSSLARDGVVLYVLVQRALAAGAASLGTIRQFVAGEADPASAVHWERLSGRDGVLSSTYAWQAGVYRQDGQLLAINRSPVEDISRIVPKEQLNGLFDGLDFDRVEEQAGSSPPLLSEVWRLFLGLMMAALLTEACLCLPRVNSAGQSSRWKSPFSRVRETAA